MRRQGISNGEGFLTVPQAVLYELLVQDNCGELARVKKGLVSGSFVSTETVCIL